MNKCSTNTAESNPHSVFLCTPRASEDRTAYFNRSIKILQSASLFTPNQQLILGYDKLACIPELSVEQLDVFLILQASDLSNSLTMKLTPREQESLLIHQAGYLAQKRLARGCKLNHPEAVALIACQIQEFARNGDTVVQLMNKGKCLLGRKQVMQGVGDMIHDVQVEATFPDGTKLVTVSHPICRENGDLTLALYGSFLPVPDISLFQGGDIKEEFSKLKLSIPGCVIPQKGAGDIPINEGRKRVTLRISSVCDRPIQIGSHYHFIEANKNLVFDRAKSYGMRLDIPAGNAIRFEPGEVKTVTLVEIGGGKIITGGNNLCNGRVNKNSLSEIMQRITNFGFGNEIQQKVLVPTESYKIPRFLYALNYGPTTGDKIRLGDTTLIVEIEKDFAVYGDECKFGGGKVLREGMGQASYRVSSEVLDTVITNCVIIDAVQGILKADVGIKAYGQAVSRP
ncbi:urease [Caerostris extrusa]|uniref:urease n=1 Tax=Caerostris extrusa TaxID=172846 RepID=A0AAV4SDU5_CAEEX|nr:urease [Caerostris extrusa]